MVLCSIVISTCVVEFRLACDFLALMVQSLRLRRLVKLLSKLMRSKFSAAFLKVSCSVTVVDEQLKWVAFHRGHFLTRWFYVVLCAFKNVLYRPLNWTNLWSLHCLVCKTWRSKALNNICGIVVCIVHKMLHYVSVVSVLRWWRNKALAGHI